MPVLFRIRDLEYFWPKSNSQYFKPEFTFTELACIFTFCIKYYWKWLFSDCKQISKIIRFNLRLTRRCPRYFASQKRPRGWMQPPWIFAFPSEIFENISHGYVFGVKESNGDNEKILSLLHDLENQGQTLFCMTFLISGCKHYTKLILVSILTFSRSRIWKMLKKITWSWRLTLELKVTHIHCMTFLSSGYIHATDSILVSILTFTMSRISENSKSVTWPWWLTLKMKVKHICVWPFVSLVVNIIQTWSLYRF